MNSTGEPQSQPLTNHNYSTHQDFLYSLDLFNNEFYWEAHVYLEAIWNANKRLGEIADLCKAVIIIAAAGVKFKGDSLPPAIGHLNRAKELLNTIDQQQLCGIDIKELLFTISHVLGELSKPLPQFTIKITLKL